MTQAHLYNGPLTLLVYFLVYSKHSNLIRAYCDLRTLSLSTATMAVSLPTPIKFVVIFRH